MWTERYILGLVFCFGYTDYKFICYLLLFVICLFVAVIYLFARSTSTNCEISSNLVKTVLAFLIFCLLEASFTLCSCISCWIRIGKCWLYFQKQPSIGVLTKSCSENMQQIYRRTIVSKRDFNKVAKQIYWNHTSARLFPVNLLYIFRTPFYKNTYGGLLLYYLPYIILRSSQENVWKESATKGNSKAAGCMAANLLKMNFFTRIIKTLY